MNFIKSLFHPRPLASLLLVSLVPASAWAQDKPQGCRAGVDVVFTDALGLATEVASAEINLGRASNGTFRSAASAASTTPTTRLSIAAPAAGTYLLNASYSFGVDVLGQPLSFVRQQSVSIACGRTQEVAIAIPTGMKVAGSADVHLGRPTRPGRLAGAVVAEALGAASQLGEADLGKTESVVQGGCASDDFADGNLAPFSVNRIGNDALGSAAEAAGRLRLSAAGTELYHGSDNGTMVHQTVDGDFRAEIEIVGFPVDQGGQFRKAGLMVRSGLGANDARVMAMAVAHFPPSNAAALQFDVRLTNGGNATEIGSTVQNVTLPMRLAIQKRGDLVEVFYASPGNEWIKAGGALGGQATMPALASPVLVGAMASSYSANTTVTAELDNFRLCQPESDDPILPPPPPPCDPGSPLDVVFLLDMSGSMHFVNPDGSTKFTAAKASLRALNDALIGRGDGSRAALITFSGVNRDPAHNLANGARLRANLSGDLVGLNAILDGLSLAGTPNHATTPLPIALRLAAGVITDQVALTGSPIVIAVGDWTPNIDIRGFGAVEYPLDQVQAIPLKDGSNWRSKSEVAWTGNYRGSSNSFTGETLANSMALIEGFAQELNGTRIFGVVTTGDGSGIGTYRLQLAEYAAYFTSGEFFTADNQSEMVARMTEIMTAVNCGEDGLSSIGDTVWYDQDGDGNQDPDENGLAGVTVNLLDLDKNLLASTTTDGDGHYRFSGLTPGTYEVVVDTATLPVGIGDQTYDFDGVDSADYALVTVAAYQGQNDVDFGYDLDKKNDAPPLVECIEDNFNDDKLHPDWQAGFIGNANSGFADEKDGKLYVVGNGSEMFDADHGFFVYRAVQASALRVEVDLRGMVSGSGALFEKTGLMIRSSLDALAPRLMVQFQPNWPGVGGSLQFRYRTSQGATGSSTWATNLNPVNLPVRVAIEKHDDIYTVEYSTDDGVNWTRPVGGTAAPLTAALGDDLLIGMSVTSYAATTSIGGFDNFSLCPLEDREMIDEACVSEAEASPYSNYSGGHALWMPGISKQLVHGNTPGTWTQYSDGTARYTGTVHDLSNVNKIFEVDLQLSGYTTVAPPGSPKKELSSNAYAPVGPINPSTWFYYTTSDAILTGRGLWEGAVIQVTRRGPAFQVGKGANNKNLKYGGSGWFDWKVIQQPSSGPALQVSGDGDFNLDYDCDEIVNCILEAPPDQYSASGTLWGFSLAPFANDLRFVTPGTFTEYSDGTARLEAQVYKFGEPNKKFDVLVTLSGRTTSPPPGSPKLELHPNAYVPIGPIDPSIWHYYPTFNATFTGLGDWAGALVNVTRRGPAWQVGVGANNNNANAGASAWFFFTTVHQPHNHIRLPGTGIGDMKIEFGCPPAGHSELPTGSGSQSKGKG